MDGHTISGTAEYSEDEPIEKEILALLKTSNQIQPKLFLTKRQVKKIFNYATWI